MVTFPLPLPEPWVWIFLGLLSWESSEFPGGNAQGCVGFPKSVALRTFQKSPRKVIDFQFVQLFLVVRMGICLPSSLHVRVDTRSLYLKKWRYICIYLHDKFIGGTEEELASGTIRIKALNLPRLLLYILISLYSSITLDYGWLLFCFLHSCRQLWTHSPTTLLPHKERAFLQHQIRNILSGRIVIGSPSFTCS